MNERQLFLKHLAPTSMEPMALPISKAKGSLLFTEKENEYIDLIGGISVCNIGHCHHKVVAAIKQQADEYLHVMVYGETIQTPQIKYAHLLTQHLPETLDCVYFTNSGAEAVEGAMKLAKRITGRTEIIAANNSYHGSTQGALSIMGSEYWRNNFRPLLPDIKHIQHNSIASLEQINEKTACIILEPIQAEAGVLVPDLEWMQALRKKCDDTGCLLILDEIQTGFGRTGKLWAFEHFGIVPDILLLGKALGGGLPMGAFIASHKKMQHLAENPVLGHLTTFGGHPLCCAAGLAAFEVLLDEKLIINVVAKEALFLSKLRHPKIKAVRSKGLMMAVELEDANTVNRLIQHICLNINKGTNKGRGVFTDWFLFAPNCIRIVPPLNIENELIEEACAILVNGLNGMDN